MGTHGGGFLIWSIEYQQRGLVHAHIAYRPASLPDAIKDAYDVRGCAEGSRLDWIDKLVCARLPSFSVLREFELLVTEDEFRSTSSAGGQVLPDFNKAVACKLNDADSDDARLYVHPDIMHDKGIYDPVALLVFIETHVCGSTNHDANGVRNKEAHWSTEPFTNRGNSTAKMIHKHPGGPDVKTAWCENTKKKCKYPMKVAQYTQMGEQGHIDYRRTSDDIMVVPYNPWIVLYFQGHINVEVVATALVVCYLFKYLLKGLDTANIHVTDDPDKKPDEVAQFVKARVRCSPQAKWRMNENQNYGQEPSVEKLAIHEDRSEARGPQDKGFSDLEQYFERPLLAGASSETFSAWSIRWKVGSIKEYRAPTTPATSTAAMIDHRLDPLDLSRVDCKLNGTTQTELARHITRLQDDGITKVFSKKKNNNNNKFMN
jgi:hypothetical protein